MDINDVTANDVALVGIPLGAHSSQLKRAAKAPKLIRDKIYGGFANLTSELGVNLKDHTHIKNTFKPVASGRHTFKTIKSLDLNQPYLT